MQRKAPHPARFVRPLACGKVAPPAGDVSNRKGTARKQGSPIFLPPTGDLVYLPRCTLPSRDPASSGGGWPQGVSSLWTKTRLEHRREERGVCPRGLLLSFPDTALASFSRPNCPALLLRLLGAALQKCQRLRNPCVDVRDCKRPVCAFHLILTAIELGKGQLLLPFCRSENWDLGD